MNELQVENPELAGKAERSRAASRAPGWLRLRTLTTSRLVRRFGETSVCARMPLTIE
jgi:hypothetical protein